MFFSVVRRESSLPVHERCGAQAEKQQEFRHLCLLSDDP
jgi:hypothetical protein